MAFDQERFKSVLSEINVDRVLGASGLAILSAYSLFAFALDPAQTLNVAVASYLSNIGLNVLAGVLQDFFGQLDNANDIDSDAIISLAKTLTRDIKRDALLRREVGEFLDTLDAYEIAKEVVQGNPALHGWLLTRTYSEISQHRVDFDHIHTKLGEMKNLIEVLNLRLLNQESPEIHNGSHRSISQSPPLPPHYVRRPDISARIESSLLSNSTTQFGVSNLTAIHGLGGIGKSTSISAISKNPAVTDKYFDGVLWITLGQHPDILTLLGGWVQALNDYKFRPVNVELTTAHLCHLLSDRAMLIIIDDVWKPEHVKPFIVGGNNCHTILTTRRSDIANDLGARIFHLGEMSPNESIQLLEKRLHREFDDRELEEALILAKAVNHLPLALELSAARINRGQTWTALIVALTAEIAQLEKLDSPRLRRVGNSSSLEASFNLSLNAIKEEDRFIWEAFNWLGTIPEDTLINPLMAATLWEIEVDESVEILELLWNDALLKPNTTVSIRSELWQTYTLHDLLHDTARRNIARKPPLGLGFSFPNAHIQVLNRFRKKTRGNQWYTIPYDGYIHRNLVWHLEQANQVGEIQSLFRETTQQGDNGWFVACEEVGEVASFLRGLDVAWQLSNQQLVSNSEIENKAVIIGHQCLYALITASLNSAFRKVPPTLLVELVNYDFWSPTQGLIYAQRILDRFSRLEAIVGIISRLPDLERRKLLSEVFIELKNVRIKYSDESRWIEAVKRLLVFYTEYPQEIALQQLLEKISGNKRLVLGLVPYLPPPFIEHIVSTIEVFETEIDRIEVLCKLAENALQSQMSEIVKKSEDNFRKLQTPEELVRAWLFLSPFYKPQRASEILNLASSVQRDSTRIDLLCELIPFISQSDRADALQELRETVSILENDRQKTTLLTKIAQIETNPRSLELLSQAIETADLIEMIEIPSLNHFGPKLDFEQMSYEYVAAKTSAFSKISLVAVSKDVLEIAIKSAERIPEPSEQVVTFLEILASGKYEKRDELIEKCWQITKHLHPNYSTFYKLPNGFSVVGNSEHKFLRVLRKLAPYLTKTQLIEAFQLVSIIGDRKNQIKTILQLSPHLPKRLSESTFELFKEGENNYESVQALEKMVDNLSYELKVQTVDLLTTMLEEKEDVINGMLSGIARTLAYLAPQLQEDLQDQVSNLSISTVRKLYTRTAAHNIGILAKHLSNKYLPEIFDIAKSFEDGKDKAIALKSIAPFLPKPMLREALETARRIRFNGMRRDWMQCIALEGLVPHLPYSMMPSAFTIIKEMESVYNKIEALILMIPYVPDQQRENLVIKTLSTILEYDLQPSTKIEFLRDISHYLPETEYKKLIIALRQSASIDQVEPYLEYGDSNNTFEKFVLELPTSERVRLQCFLLPHMPKSEQKDIAREAISVVRSNPQKSSYTYLAIGLIQIGLHEQVLPLVQELQNNQEISELLAEIIPVCVENEYYDTAMHMIADLHNRHWHFSEVTIRKIAPKIPPKYVEELIPLAQNSSDSNRISIMSTLAQRIPDMSEENQVRIWNETLHIRANSMRHDLFADIVALTPSIISLGGKEAVKQVYDSILDVCKWWP